MANTHASYSATKTTPRPPMNGHQSSEGTSIARTKILLLGLRRSGKTSIKQVLFNDLAPKQTFYLEPTMRIEKHTLDTVIPLEIWDCPGNITVETLGAPLSQFSSLIFVIDIRDLYQQPISKLVDFITAAYHEKPDLNLEVFVHKAEKLQEDDKIENFRQIDGRITDRLLDQSPNYQEMPINFHLTSVYDHSLHEAFSRVLHKLIESLPYLEDLLNVFCANSQSPKAFLFDTTSRLYVATDASPVDSATHNLCCDYLHMLNSFGPLYKSTATNSRRLQSPSQSALTPPPTTASSSSSSVHHSLPTSPSSSHSLSPTSGATPARAKELFYPSASTTLSPSTSGTTLTYHLITRQLALLALIPTAVYETRRGLVEYNVVFFREGVQEICDVERETRGGQ
ncbi:hypothetical protein PLICRDRAFT_94696 [Plicaturopsis crispa FD-325 SS-3]|uniref:GTP-binding protein n=1 Tax=Plicaturopsis crispa FD-325 SS-3 TaxID=944288 RepID=A0A0C9SYK7_PLICR|nr:hypothetical protein PLICRDRAFT_94696 [Plicaturopsis crispa FD-325 SS-3]